MLGVLSESASTTHCRLRVFLSTIGSAGDVNPFVAIGSELKRRGHQVTLVTSAYFEPLARGAGLDFVGLGTPGDYRATVDDPDLWDPKGGFRVFARRVVIPAMRPLYDIVSENLSSNAILVAQGQTFGAHIAHEKHGMPFVTVHLQPAAFRTIHDAPLMPGWIPPLLRPAVYALFDYLVLDRELAGDVNAFRSQLGLPKVRSIFGSWAHSPQKSIGLFPDWFAPPQPDWPAQAELAGFVFLDEAPRPVDPALVAFLAEGEAPIVFTPGTAMRHADLFFRASIQASIELGRRALLLTQYPEQVPSPLPDGVATFAYVPFAAVLPHSVALVHHGGIGTVAQALAAGIPQLVRPMTFDQPDNAARVQRLGVGLSIRPDQYMPNTVVKMLHTLLHSQDVLTACRYYSSLIHSDTGLAAACNAIEAVGGLPRLPDGSQEGEPGTPKPS
jgi:rhamnosyltransferase subunit B